jgi:hypothetical protein
MADKLGFAGWSTIIATWVGIAGAGVGGWTAIEQQQKAIEGEQKQAQKEFEQAEKEYDQQERQFLAEVKTTYVETFKMFEIFNRSDQLAAREKIYDFIREPAKQNLKLNDVFIFFDFFDALQICVINEICDEYVATELFKPYAEDVWKVLQDDVAMYRKETNPKLGIGVEWLALLRPSPPGEEAVSTEGSAPSSAAQP